MGLLRFVWAVLWAAALAGCVSVSQGPVSSRVVEGSDVVTPPANSPAAGRDMATASDETDVQKRARIRLELAGAYFSQGQSATALDELKRALQIDPNNAQAYNLRALISASLGDTALAEESFRRALQLAPGNGDTLHNYAWYLCSQRRFGEAQTQFAAALAQPQYRNASKTLLAQGVCQARAGDWAGAEKTLQRSYELDAANPATAINLAEVLLRRGEVERSRFYVSRVNAVPELADAETLWLAARIEHRRGNAAGVEEYASQLRKRFPGSRQAGALERGQFDEQ